MQSFQTEVLTIEEVANYLRLPTETVERQAAQGKLPGRKIEDDWRFLKTAVDDWLRSHDAQAILLQQSGTLAGDDTMEELLAVIYQARGRAESEETVS